MNKTKYLTVKQVAELLNCTVRNINKQISEGKIDATERINDVNKQKQYMIPIEALPSNAREKYFGIKADRAIEKAKALMKPLSEPKSLDTYSMAQREQIVFWLRVCRAWEQVKEISQKKTEAREIFIREVNEQDKAKLEEYGVYELTDGILYRKYTAFKNNDYDGFIERRGGHNKGKSSIDDRIWDLFLWYWLDERKPTVTSCYATLGMAIDKFTDDFAGVSLPSEMAFRRRIKTDVDIAIKTLGREGNKAYCDRILPYVDRLYEGLVSNEYWIGDTHTLDFITTRADGSNGNVRLYLCAWQDARSGVLTGWYISETLSSDTVLMALRHGIMRFGIPQNVYIDNGREYLCGDIGGKGHRKRKSDEDKLMPPPVFERLKMKMVNALVRNAKAKPIERTFGTFKNQISRLISTYCGGNVLERPESLKKHLKDGKIPMGSEIRIIIGELIDSEYNLGAYGGKVRSDNGKERIAVWNENIRVKRMATEGDLALMMMRSARPQKISRNGVYITINDEKLWYYSREITALMGRQVYIRYDSAALETVRVYMAATDEYIATVPMAKDLMLLFGAESAENISTAMELVGNVKKSDVKRLKSIKNNLPTTVRIDMLDYRIRKAHEIPFGELINNNVPIEIVRAEDKPYFKSEGSKNGIVIDIKKIVNGI